MCSSDLNLVHPKGDRQASKEARGARQEPGELGVDDAPVHTGKYDSLQSYGRSGQRWTLQWQYDRGNEDRGEDRRCREGIFIG